jgi:hypothetical protein
VNPLTAQHPATRRAHIVHAVVASGMRAAT